MGLTINTMVLAGLVIAMGEVVDDAIIDVENIVRRLRLNRAVGIAAVELSRRAGGIVGSPKRGGVCKSHRHSCVHPRLLPRRPCRLVLPAAGAGVRAGDRRLALGRVDGHAGALADAPDRGDRTRHESPLVRLLKAIYGAILPGIVRRPGIAVVVLVAAFAGTGWLVMGLGEEFMPNFQESDFLMHFVEKPGTSLEAMRRVTERAGNELLAMPEVRNFGSHIGRAEVADEVVGPNFTELWISVDPKADHNKTMAKIEEVVKSYPGLYRDVLTYLKERIKEVLTGAGATVVVRVFGPDMDVLRAKAARNLDGDQGRAGRHRPEGRAAGDRPAA